MKHKLKIIPDRFEAILEGIKTFEIRFNDRNFQVGDILLLAELAIGHPHITTGRMIWAEICYIDDYAQQRNYVILGLKDIELINGR